MTPYITLKSEAESEYTEKRSTFIGHAYPVTTEEEAIALIGKIKKSYPDARHNVYAYSIFADNSYTKRFSDDGEPQGTAGMPILDVLQKQNITNALVTVTRYFGGILLGASGLLRAYTQSAVDAVRLAGIKEISVCRKVSACIDYNQYGRIEKIFSSFPAIALPPVFQDKIVIDYIIKEDFADSFVTKLTDATSGNIKTDISDPFYRDLNI